MIRMIGPIGLIGPIPRGLFRLFVGPLFQRRHQNLPHATVFPAARREQDRQCFRFTLGEFYLEPHLLYLRVIQVPCVAGYRGKRFHDSARRGMKLEQQPLALLRQDGMARAGDGDVRAGGHGPSHIGGMGPAYKLVLYP